MPPRYPASRPTTTGLSPLERVVGLAIALALAASGVFYATAQLLARLLAGQPPPVGFAEMAPVSFRIAAEPSDPAAAFGPETAALLPGPEVFWTVALLLTVAPLALAWWALGRRAPTAEPDAARWATPRELRPLQVPRPGEGRLVLGRSGRQLLATEPSQAVIVFGPARSGKTTGLAIPAILEWDGPVIATSVRADLVEATRGWRQTLGDTWLYDPTRAAPHLPTAGWDPLQACTSWQDAQRTAQWMSDVGRQGARFGDGDFWYATATKLLAPLLFAAAVGGRTMADVLAWLDTQEEEEVIAELARAHNEQALHAAHASFNREDRQRSSVYTTAEMILRAFADPDVLAACERSDITAERLLDGGAHTLYVTAPAHEQHRLQPLFSALLQHIITAAYDRAASGKPLDKPLLIVLDEAANIAPLRDLDTLASTAAGTGIQLMTIWQDLAQIQARYGNHAATVVNNHRAKLVLSGIADDPTLRYVSTLVGETQVTHHARTRDANGQRSTSESPHWRQLASADGLRRITPGHGLLLYGHLPPARLQLRPFYNDRTLRQRAETPTHDEATQEVGA